MTFTVSTAATKTSLTTLAAVKLELGITDRTDDSWLTSQIEWASDTICEYLGVAQAEDGTRTLGRETLVETIDLTWPTRYSRPGYSYTYDYVTLSRGPVTSVTSITEDGDAVASTDYRVSASTRRIERLSSDVLTVWPASLVVVTYQAGWLLPSQSGRNLPANIEAAAIDLVKGAWFARKRDPALKSQEVTGVYRADYFFGTPSAQAILKESLSRAMVF